MTVLESAPKIMSRQLDDATSDRLQHDAEQYGIRVVTGADTSALLGDEQGHVTGVSLADGTVCPAQIVVLSCGKRANRSAAQEAGAPCGRAVLTDAHMRTSLPDVYACGDCAQFEGVNCQLWPEAGEQGRVAGANAAGEPLTCANSVCGSSFIGMNLKLYAIGDVGKEGKDYRIVEFRDEIRGAFRRYWFSDDELVGGILYNDTDRMQMLIDAVNARSSYRDVAADL